MICQCFDIFFDFAINSIFINDSSTYYPPKGWFDDDIFIMFLISIAYLHPFLTSYIIIIRCISLYIMHMQSGQFLRTNRFHKHTLISMLLYACSDFLSIQGKLYLLWLGGAYCIAGFLFFYFVNIMLDEKFSIARDLKERKCESWWRKSLTEWYYRRAKSLHTTELLNTVSI